MGGIIYTGLNSKYKFAVQIIIRLVRLGDMKTEVTGSRHSSTQIWSLMADQISKPTTYTAVIASIHKP